MKRKAARHTKNREPDLYLLGIGIGGSKVMTLETLEVLKRARVVFDMSDKPKIIKNLNLNANLVYLDDTYWSGQPFEDVYQNIIEIVLAEIERGPGVALVGYGHPLVFDSINFELLQIAKRRGITVEVLPGVSCLDTICIDLGIDLGDGVQIFEADDLVSRRLSMNSKMEALVLQIGYFGITRTDGKFDFEPNHFTPLAEHIAKYYGHEQMVTLVHSDDGDGPKMFRARLRNLDRNRGRILSGMTLFVPAQQE